MSSSVRLPARFPVGSKYVLESRGSFVQRCVEFPDGRRVRLSRRKALLCECWELQQISIASAGLRQFTQPTSTVPTYRASALSSQRVFKRRHRFLAARRVTATVGFIAPPGTSAFGGKADMTFCTANVCF